MTINGGWVRINDSNDQTLETMKNFYISLKYNELEDLEFLNTTEFKKFAREQLKEYNGGEEPTDQRWTDLFFEED